MKNSATVVNKHFMCPVALAKDLSQMAQQENTNETQIMIRALKLYRAQVDLQRSPIITDDILSAMQAQNQLMGKSISRSINRSLNALAVNIDVLMLLLAHTVELDDRLLYQYRNLAQRNLRETLHQLPSIDRAMEQEAQMSNGN